MLACAQCAEIAMEDIGRLFENEYEPKKAMDLLHGTRSARKVSCFCRDCGEFVDEKAHKEREEFTEHMLVSTVDTEGSLKRLVLPRKENLLCSSHQDKELDFYCETCEEMICSLCTLDEHRSPEHKYDLLRNSFERHKDDITTTVKERVCAVDEALEQVDVRLCELRDQFESVNASIERQMKKLQYLLDRRKARLIQQSCRLFHIKRRKLEAQKNKMAKVKMELFYFLSSVDESLNTESQIEMMRTTNAVMNRMRHETHTFNASISPPCEPANIKFIHAVTDFAEVCQHFGKVYLHASPGKCHTTGKGLIEAECDERATAVLHVVDPKGEPCFIPIQSLACELESEITGQKEDCSIVKTADKGMYEIGYLPASRGRHQLHIKVEGDHIKGSPFPVPMYLQLHKLATRTPMRTISGLKRPWGVAINHDGNIVVAETCNVSVFSPLGKTLLAFRLTNPGSEGARGVAIDKDNNILIVDWDKGCVQKYTSCGEFVTESVKSAKSWPEMDCPIGIAVNPRNDKVYVANTSGHRIQILNPDLTFSGYFGSKGDEDGQFVHPWDVACDSVGNVYVADSDNHRIQVFTAEGKYLRQFGGKGEGSGELKKPSGIAIGGEGLVYVTERNNHRVTVFTSEGEFQTSFGSEKSGHGYLKCPRGIAVDKDGVVCVSDDKGMHLI